MNRGATAWQLAGAYLGGLIGAGFASGREHLQFFLAFGSSGYWGVLLAGALLALSGAAFMRLAYRHRTESHRDLVRALVPPLLAQVFDAVLCCLALASVSVMMAGGGALFERTGAGEAAWGALALGGCAALIVALGLGPMLRVNGFITAALCVAIAAVGVASFIRPAAGPPVLLDYSGPAGPAEPFDLKWTPGVWYASAALYGAYNLTFGFALFGALGSGIRSEKDARAGGIAGGVLLALLSLFVCLSVERSLPESAALEIPMLAAVEPLGGAALRAYVAAIWLAMLTTAIAGVYALSCRVRARVRLPFALVPFGVLMAALPVSLLGFRLLVATLYPLCGYIGIGCLAAAALARRKKGRR